MNLVHKQVEATTGIIQSRKTLIKGLTLRKSSVEQNVNRGQKYSDVCFTKATTSEEAALVRSINSAVKQIEGKFCCGGSIPVPSQGIRIWYSKDEDAQGLLHLPIATAYDDRGIEELAATCTEVPGGEELVSEMLPSSFATNFDLGHFFILDEIHRLLAPGSTLRAELYRLRVFQPGARLKVERPAEKTAGPATSDQDAEFGSLVVSLPVAFTGGDLVVSAGTAGRSHRFSWGGEPLGVFWAAFISDCEHELGEVTSGYMLTLTYKLYKLPDTNKRKRVLGVSETLVDPHTLPVYEILSNALQCPKFCSDGGILGFACQHQYSIDNKLKYKDMSRDDKTWLLKGADAMLFAAAKSVGLKAELRPIYKNSSAESPAVLYVGKTIGEKVPGFLGEFDKEFEGLDNEPLGIEELPTARDGVKTDVEISWCLKNFSWVAGQSKGDEMVEVPWYRASAVVLTVPSWEERQEKLLATKDGEDGVPASKKAKVYEDAIAAWFRKAEERASREIDYEYREGNREDGEAEEDEEDEEEDEEDEEDEDEEDDEDEEEKESEKDGGDGDAQEAEKTQEEVKAEDDD